LSETALDLARRALEAAEGDEAEAVVQSERSGFARFADSEVHQPTLIDNAVVQLRVLRDGRLGSALTNRGDRQALGELARKAAEAADLAPPDPDFPGFAQAAELPEVEGYDATTASLDAEAQARLAGEAIEAAHPFAAYGFFTSAESELAVVTSKGVDAHQRMTDATTVVISAGDDASGYAERTAWRAGLVEPGRVGREASGTAARTRGASTLEPGRYPAVLEPYAFAELLQWFAWDSFSGLGILEERSALCDRIGDRVADPMVSIWDDPLDPDGLPKGFDFEGVPKRRVPLIEDGVARGVVWDRATAARAGNGVVSTGHAPPPPVRVYGPMPTALSVAPGEAESVDELAGLVGEGIYVTRLHYLGIVNPREGVITGMTRDGTFRIRGGRIAEPLVNLRFTVAVLDLLAEVPGLTRARRLVNQNQFYDERYPQGVLCPALATASFNVTGSGSGPGL
jgi:predicted Zn-dependent protease